MIRRLTQFIHEAAPGAEAKSCARSLDRLTRSLRQTLALRDKIAAGQAARDARSALRAAELSPPMPARAVEEWQRPRLVYSRPVDAGAKLTDRGPPNG